MGRKVTGPQDINVRRLIRELENTKIKIWRVIADTLKKARRKRVEANIGRINRVTKDGDVIVVPGKVLGAGNLERKITIGALTWSEKAEKIVNDAGSSLITLDKMIEKYPNGSNVRIIK